MIFINKTNKDRLLIKSINVQYRKVIISYLIKPHELNLSDNKSNYKGWGIMTLKELYENFIETKDTKVVNEIRLLGYNYSSLDLEPFNKKWLMKHCIVSKDITINDKEYVALVFDTGTETIINKGSNKNEY